MLLLRLLHRFPAEPHANEILQPRPNRVVGDRPGLLMGKTWSEDDPFAAERFTASSDVRIKHQKNRFARMRGHLQCLIERRTPVQLVRTPCGGMQRNCLKSSEQPSEQDHFVVDEHDAFPEEDTPDVGGGNADYRAAGIVAEAIGQRQSSLCATVRETDESPNRPR